MSKRAQENLMALAILLVFIGFLVIGMTYSPKARLVPVPLAIVSILLILLQLYLQNFRTDIKLNVDAMDLFARQNPCDVEANAESAACKPTSSTRGGKESQAFGIVGLVVALIWVIGLFPAVLAFVFGYFALVGKERVLKSTTFAVITTATLYGLFSVLLGVPAYDGLLGSILSGLGEGL